MSSQGAQKLQQQQEDLKNANPNNWTAKKIVTALL
jgi:hypothetical protein